MATKRKAEKAKPRTTHRLVINADNPVPSPVSSHAGAVVDAEAPEVAPRQTDPTPVVVTAEKPVPAPGDAKTEESGDAKA